MPALFLNWRVTHFSALMSLTVLCHIREKLCSLRPRAGRLQQLLAADDNGVAYLSVSLNTRI